MIPIRDNIPTRRFPVVTVVLIAINTAVWLLYQLPDLDTSVVEAGWVPCEIAGTCDPPGPSWHGGFDLLAPTGSGTGGIAFFAHIGGFAFGVLVGLVLRGRNRPRTPAWPRSEL
jgi:membrane associated rhomboid family serine protease